MKLHSIWRGATVTSEQTYSDELQDFYYFDFNCMKTGQSAGSRAKQ